MSTPRADFLEELDRILHTLRDSYPGVSLRLVGALAFRLHCPAFGSLQEAMGRVFTDIDFAAWGRDRSTVQQALRELGYEEDVQVTRMFGDQRLIFHDATHARHVDVFFDALRFSHVIPLRDRLDVDWPTVPLAELLLEKMQIVQLNEKDLVDTVMLLREHPVGREDRETINASVISHLCAGDWGLWRTVTANLRRVQPFAAEARLGDADREIVRERAAEVLQAIDAAPKTLRWRLRGQVGERVRWYAAVEEVAHRSG